MTERTKDYSPRTMARIAGFLYLLIIVGALFIPFATVPSGMMRGDAALPTVAHILAAKQLYILGGNRASDPGGLRYRRGSDPL
jgi:hypothetical protein